VVVVTELGLASELHGEDAQAESLAAQLRLADECGLAGATVFAWTDEWNVGGNEVEGWGFGLTDAERDARPALAAVSRWARSSIRDLRDEWPRVSVVVCAYQAADTIEECLVSLVRSKYPDLEVIVCDDGSTDRTGRLARRYPFPVLTLERGGLSNARNAGVAAATGEIVAFLDADAACHPEWPYHLALSLEDENVVATGGPNLPVPGAGLVERTVAASPGGPIHVLVSDDRAEHVPGCNMAFRREALEEIGYFDPVYTAAGDDVDVCWKLLDRGHEIAFSAAAQVLHHRRGTVRGYVRQQLGYGKAERLMASRHRHRFNGLGQARWGGFIYGTPPLLARLLRPVVYHGSMGSAPFQPVVGRRAEAAHAWLSAFLPLLVPILLLGLLGALSPWFFLAPALALATVVGYAGAVARSVRVPHGEPRPRAFRLLAAYLHVVQPLARTWGRLRARVPEAVANGHRFAWLGDRSAWLDGLARQLASRGGHVRFSEAHEPWDLELRKGPFLRARVTTAVLWSWTPSHRVRYGARWTVLLPLVAIAAAAAWLGVEELWALGLVAIALLIETWALIGAVDRAVRVTTEGARSKAAEERHEVPAPARRLREYARERL
jgi:GT2 family glycosyltransferase